MNEHDDTKTRTVYHVASTADGGHFVARTAEGKLVQGVTYEHAETHHPEMLTDAGTEPVTLAPPLRGDGPPRVATDAYRAGWERVFGKREAGEA